MSQGFSLLLKLKSARNIDMKRPLLQVALDVLEEKVALEIAVQIAPVVEILEVGTPLLKAVGAKIITELKQRFPQNLILADTKTMDVGALEAALVFEAGADFMTVCAAAPLETIEAAIGEAKRWKRKVVVDFIGIRDKLKRAKDIVPLGPDYFGLHTAIDVQRTQGKSFKELAVFKEEFNIPLAIAGGITPEDIREIMTYSPEIIVVGGFVTKAKHPYEAVMALRREIEYALS